MKNRFISIILSALILSSSLSQGILAVPTVAGVADRATEDMTEPADVINIPSQSENEDNYIQEDNASSRGPKAITVSDTLLENDGEYIPVLLETASLMSELSGDGTEQSPYLISNADELKIMANNINSGVNSDAFYSLTANIDLQGAEWAPMGNNNLPFSGVFDGNGYTVSNLKITRYTTSFIGFFGFVSNGAIKNLNIDNMVINLDTEKAFTFYAGIIAGRIKTNYSYDNVEISGCNITNSSIKIKNNGTIYAGGVSGAVLANPVGSSICFSLIEAQCDIDISSHAQNMAYNKETEEYERHVASAGGLVAFITAKTGTVVTISGCNVTSNIKSSTINSPAAQPMGGGLLANTRTVDDSASTDGKMIIRQCSSHGTVYADTSEYPYALGGFSGQFYSKTNLSVYDCYSTSDVSGKYLSAGKTDYEDPSAAGFVGQAIFDSSKSTINNCYATGDVIDLTHTETTAKDTSFVGGFTAWVTTKSLKNCYRLESQTLWGSDINSTDEGNVTALSAEDALIAEKYVGFDFSKTWKMDSLSEYPYPTLREKTGFVNFVSQDILIDTVLFDENGKISPSTFPAKKASTVDKVFELSHWSLEEDGAAFDFENTALSENTVLYAVFSSSPRPYEVRFINEGKTFGSVQKLGYGTSVTAPNAIPEKSDTVTYYYTFLHWSDTENGEAYDFTDCTVIGNMTFYAVYKETDKSAWEGAIAPRFSSGFGTEALPYIISTSEELALLAKLINEKAEGYTDAYYALGSNIHLGDNVWAPIGSSKDTPFSAHFDGRGYTIKHFQLSENRYVGLFGYILCGTVKNLGISDFTVDIAPFSSSNDACIYVGALAGYISSAYYGQSSISQVGITNGSIKINANVCHVYAGFISGYADSNIRSQTLISDCFADGSISIINAKDAGNEDSYSYTGGLVGRLYTGSNSLSEISHSYYKGTINSQSFNSSRAGGLVGYLYSAGTAYTSSEDTAFTAGDDDYEEENSHLLSDDIDIMIRDSFAIANVTSYSTHNTSAVGRIVGLCNSHAGIENVVYPRSISSATAILGTGKLAQAVETTEGYATEPSNLKSAEILSKNRGFDFDNVWTFTDDYEYPALSCILSVKPMLDFTAQPTLKDGILKATVGVFSKHEIYTVVIGVYNSRNQLLKFERVNLSYSSDILTEIPLSYSGMDNAKTLVITAYETKTMLPLFNALSIKIQ